MQDKEGFEDFEDFDLEAAGLMKTIISEAAAEDMHSCSVASACLDVILLLGRSLSPMEREVLVELLQERLDTFAIEEYKEGD